MADLAIPIAPSLAPFDPNVSNGTCFFAPGRAHTARYIPCGNSGSPGAGGGARSLPCCLAGDYCQSSNACYSPSTDNVYLAGCTDPDYKASTCPYKSPAYAEQEWVGMVWSCEARQQMGQAQHAAARPPPPEGNLVDQTRNITAVAMHKYSYGHSHGNHNLTTAAEAEGGGVLGSDKNNNSTGAPGFIALNQNGGGDDDDKLISWAGCPLPRLGSVVPERMYNMCDPCSPQRDGLFRDGKYLTRVAKLPGGVGGVVQWEPGFGPGVVVVTSAVQTISMSSCVSTMSTAAAGVAGFGAGVSPTATDASSSGESNTADDNNSGNQDDRHPAGDRTNIIVGSTSAVVIVLLAAALAWLLTKRHQRKRQEREVVREMHLALARGPSPPQLVTVRGGRGQGSNGHGAYFTPDTAPAGVEGSRAGEMQQQQRKSSGVPEMAGLLSPVGSVHRVPVPGKEAAQLSRMNSTRSSSRQATPQMPRISSTAVPPAQRWSTATEMTANTTTSSMAMTAQTTNTSTDVTMTPISLHTPKFLRTPTATGVATSPLLVRKTSMTSMSTCSLSGGERCSTGYFPCPEADVQQSEGDRGVQAQGMPSPEQDITHDGRHSNRTSYEQLAIHQDHAVENNPPSKAGSDHNGIHDSGSEGEGSINIDDGDDSESLSSYQGGTISEVQKLRIRIVDPNTARLLILGKKPKKDDVTRNEGEGSGTHCTSNVGEQ
ncbi:axial budding pattern protein 2 [Microdochium nivale]|nr:axial budding pattern protein 2 [Microdochium nivale]